MTNFCIELCFLPCSQVNPPRHGVRIKRCFYRFLKDVYSKAKKNSKGALDSCRKLEKSKDGQPHSKKWWQICSYACAACISLCVCACVSVYLSLCACESVILHMIYPHIVSTWRFMSHPEVSLIIRWKNKIRFTSRFPNKIVGHQCRLNQCR